MVIATTLVAIVMTRAKDPLVDRPVVDRVGALLERIRGTGSRFRCC